MNIKPPAINDKFWERLRYRGIPIKEYVLRSLPDSAPQVFRDLLWQAFKQQCAAQGNFLPLLIYELEPQDCSASLFRRQRGRTPRGSDPFEDLPLRQRLNAREIFSRLCQKWAGNLPSWRRAILAGVARRLTLHPHGSDWGKRMRRIKGGIHCQEGYRKRGWHPLPSVLQAMTKRQIPQESTEPASQFPIREHAPRLIPQPSRQDQRRTDKRADVARKRLCVTSEQMQGVPRITSLLECAPGGIESLIDALRLSDDEDAIAFIDKYDSIPKCDLEHLSIEEICVAAGLEPVRFLGLAASSLVEYALCVTKIIAASFYPKVLRKTAEMAVTDEGVIDRKTFLLGTGFLPSA